MSCLFLSDNTNLEAYYSPYNEEIPGFNLGFLRKNR